MLRVAGMLRSNRSRPAALLRGFPVPRKSWKGKNVSASRPRGVSWGGNGPGLRHKRAGSGRILCPAVERWRNSGDTAKRGAAKKVSARLSERARPCASKISDAHTSQCIVSKQDASGVWQNPSCRTGSLTGRQNLGFPLKEQHLRLE